MGIRLPLVKECCFCATLRTGSLIIGYLSIAVSVLSLLAWTGLIVVVSLFVKKNMNNPPPGHSPEDVRNASVILYVLYALKITLLLFYLSISIMLVVGVHKSKPLLMKYYFVAGMVNLLLSLLLIIVNFIFTDFITTTVQLIGCAILFYILLVVRSAYIEMEENQRPQYPKVYELQVLQQQQPLMV